MHWTPISSQPAFQNVLDRPESHFVEFKATVEWQSRDPKKGALKEMARDIAQFANSDGGSVLIGVTNAGCAVGLPEFDGPRQWIEQAITNYLVPSTIRVEVLRFPVGRNVTLVVNVWPEERLVTVWDRDQHTIEVLRRTNHGKEWLNPDEMEAHLMNTGRAKRLALIRTIAQTIPTPSVNLLSGLWEGSGPEQCRTFASADIASVDETHFSLRFFYDDRRDGSIRLPYSLIDAVWPSGNRSIDLMLRVKIVFLGSEGLALEPF